MKLWEIRYKHDARSEEDKAYDCGFEDGYKKAVEHFSHAGIDDEC